MAKIPSISSVLDVFRKTSGQATIKHNVANLAINKKTSISDNERDKLIARVERATENRRGHPDFFSRYAAPISRAMSRTKLDNEMIAKLAPEIGQAAAIVIPSIMSPNDLRDGKITIAVDVPQLTQNQNKSISEELNRYFNTELNLSNKLTEWLYDVLYKTGAKPLMLIPISELDTLIKEGDDNISTETLHHLKQTTIDTMSVFGIADRPTTKKDTVAINIDDVLPAVETIVTSYREMLKSDENDVSSSYNHRQTTKEKAVSSLAGEIGNFAKSVISAESLSIVDNPDALRANKLKRDVASQRMSSIVTKKFRYKESPLVTVNRESKPSTGHPIMMELPTESVIPIFVPGSPSEHIGYFVLIDEFGNPISTDSEDNFNDNNFKKRTDADQLYTSFGFASSGGAGSKQHTRSALMSDIYRQIVNTHLVKRMEDNGFSNVAIGSDNSIYRCMFARYLSLRKTRVLFVPKDLVTYFCFKHNSDGTGRSKLEDIKFILSLKITMLVCRMLSQMNTAINRRTLEVNLSENIADPIQFIEQLKNYAIEKSQVQFSYNPTDIMNDLARRALSVKTKGLVGASDFEITNESTDHHEVTPDDSLSETLDTLMVLSLEVPPSALNSLSTDEYSRSIATSNLFFARNMAKHQKVVCQHTTSFVRNYVSMSQHLKDAIINIIKSDVTADGKSVTADNQQLVDAVKKLREEGATVENLDIDITKIAPSDGSIDKSKVAANKSIDELVKAVIENIETSLPSPNTAPDKTQFEDMDNFIQSVNNLIDAMFSDDLTGTDPLKAISSVIKADVIRSHMTKVGFASSIDIPDVGNIDPKFILDKLLSITNIAKGISDQKKHIEPEQGGDSSSSF